jgi:bifunctional pyridoxal-dependent enzyme with beta-cystathionase and maltose regulon repressor activities
MQEKVDTNLKEIKEDIKTNQAKMVARIEANNEKFEILQGTLFSWLDVRHAKTEANPEEMMVKLDAHHERMTVSVNAWRKETVFCQEATEACPEKIQENPEEMQSEVVHEEVPKEEAQ